MQNKTGNSFFYVYDGFHHSVNGISSFIININGRNDQHLQYPKSGEQPALSADKFAVQRSTWGTSYKFNSKELDQETGLYYYGARYYNPTLSIWASVDPMSDKYPSLSPYAYCANNPVILVDPDGMEIWTTAEGWAIMERAFNATLGEKNNPFTYNSETGQVEFDKNKNIGELDDNKQEIFNNYKSLVEDKDFRVNVNVISNDESFSVNNKAETLREQKATGAAVLRADKKTVDVYISNKPLKESSNGKWIESHHPQDDKGITSLHEIGGHAYNWQQKVYGSQNSINTESFERKARDAYDGHYQKNNVRRQSVQRHKD